MIMDHVGPSIGQCIEQHGVIETECMKENPNPEAQKFFDMLVTAQAPLLASLACLSLKSDYNTLEGCFNRMAQLMGDTMPKNNTMQEAPYQDDELVGLQEVLELDPDVINESLKDVDGGGEEIDADLLKQLDLVEPDDDECMLSENDIESDFDDTDTS
ncbi:hypothetical protein GmHk_18G052244 [Glycine max]|nr:hypothetical protein GmHk_18G052244 [Glycine max]